MSNNSPNRTNQTRQVILDLVRELGGGIENFGTAQLQIDAATDRIEHVWGFPRDGLSRVIKGLETLRESADRCTILDVDMLVMPDKQMDILITTLTKVLVNDLAKKDPEASNE